MKAWVISFCISRAHGTSKTCEKWSGERPAGRIAQQCECGNFVLNSDEEVLLCVDFLLNGDAKIIPGLSFDKRDFSVNFTFVGVLIESPNEFL